MLLTKPQESVAIRGVNLHWSHGSVRYHDALTMHFSIFNYMYNLSINTNSQIYELKLTWFLKLVVLPPAYFICFSRSCYQVDHKSRNVPRCQLLK